MTPAEVIEKIKKLLRMKRGGTQGEIENALAAAARLAREHGIYLAGVNPDEPAADRLTHVEDVLKSRLPLEARYAVAILVNFFNVQICIKRYARVSVVFVGTAFECEVARYLFVFLQRHFRMVWKHRENRRLKNREAFLDGMFLGLAHKLLQQQPKGEGLIVSDLARQDYLAKLIPGAKDNPLPARDNNADASRRAGIIAGQNTEIRSGLSQPAAPDRLQLEADL